MGGCRPNPAAERLISADVGPTGSRLRLKLAITVAIAAVTGQIS